MRVFPIFGDDYICLGAPSPDHNSGPRITQEKYDEINRWRGQDTEPTDLPDMTSDPFFLTKTNEDKITGISTPDDLRHGSEISASVPIRNVGTSEAGCFDVTLFVADYSKIGELDNQQRWSIPSSMTEVCSLSPFETKSVDLSGNIPADAPAGEPLQIGWRLDSNNEITEFGEVGNNAPNAQNLYSFTNLSGIQTRIRSDVKPNSYYIEPSNPSPSDGDRRVDTSTTLSWTGGDSSVTYDVYLEKGKSNPSNLVSQGHSGTSYTANLEEDSTYYWKVVAKGPSGVETESPVWSFETVTDDSGPTAPSNPTPQSSASGLATSLSLSWDEGTSENGAVTHKVYFGTSSNPSYYTQTFGSSVDVSGLQKGTTYYWKVVADDGYETAESSTWSFTTGSGGGSISVTDLQFRNEDRDGPLAIFGPYSLDEGYLEYTEQTTEDHDNEYDLRVINDRGIVVSTEEDDAHDGDDFATKLDMDDGEASIFRTPGTHSAEVILYAHRSGETYSTTKTTTVEVEKGDDDMSVLPANPLVGETVSADVSHISQDSGETPIEGYEWTVIKNPDGNAEFVKEVSGPNKDEITFTPSEAAEYEIVASDSSNYNGYVIDDIDFQVRSSLPEPSLSVDSFSVPSTATAGDSFSADVELTNSGDATANYIIRFKANGNIHEVEAANEDEQDSRTESGDFSLPAGTHDIKAVVINSHNNKHTTQTKTVTVEENTEPNQPSIVSPSDGASDVTQQPTLEWSGGDPDGDSVTYDVRLEKGDRSPESTIETDISSTAVTPSQLENGTTYYWQVIATDEHGASRTSPVWKFTTYIKETADYPNYQLSNLNPQDITVPKGGGPIDISVGIGNNGDQAGSPDIQLEITDDTTGATVYTETGPTVSISPGEQTTVTLNDVPVKNLDAGEYTYRVSSEDDSISGSLTVTDGRTGVIGEVSKLTPKQPDQSTWFTAELRKSYDDPVVIMKPVGTAGPQPAHIRLKNVQSDSFEYKVEEWSHTNDDHAEVDVYYAVVESGTHKLNDGTTLEAGTEQINHVFSTISLSGGYSDTPVAFTQSQTYNGGDQIVTRNRNIGTNSMETRLQEEEGADGEHAYETVGYLAIETGSGDSNGVPFEAARTANIVDENPHTIEFSESFGSTPQFIADMQTFDGKDTAEVRMESLDSGSASVYIEEEQTGDTETNHGNDETVGYFAIEQGGILQATSDSSGAGTGAVTGTVTDTESNPLTGAEVSLVTESTGQVVETVTTGTGGNYRFSSVETGTYTVEASHENAEGAITTVVVEEGMTAIADLVLVTQEDDQNSNRIGFENISTGTLPSFWSTSGNDNQQVVDTTAASGDNSLKMKGSHGGCWEAIGNKGVDIPDSGSVTLSMSIKPTNKGSPGCHGDRNGRIKLSTVGGGGWSDGKDIGIAEFNASGTVSAGGSTASYNVGEWNNAKITYDRSGGEVAQDVHLNGRKISTRTRDARQFEDDISYLEIHSGDYTLYVDDIVVEDGSSDKEENNTDSSTGANPLLDSNGKALGTTQVLTKLAEWSDTGGQDGGEIDGDPVGTRELLGYLVEWQDAR